MRGLIENIAVIIMYVQTHNTDSITTFRDNTLRVLGCATHSRPVKDFETVHCASWICCQDSVRSRS